ncbi:polyhydroxyalkanoic acid system family protein [Sphingomonas sp. BIUV-7]|uniref:Polyhydroxyalkanoic acid system family protein n=1 Tax=Sphingomonas natans TaxID=3063330 RepID=A0ABT8Y399_9SPHN|nr:polyhydroxyalkanoic acid system family protein [Sphingomonas sp. BIUV-7]MDO6412787.1 polyhydroxyalkanoic acid system family protein [Sphingomonas sp. BIUV-7]
MTPITVDVPHSLGRAGARERMKARIGDLAGHIPGGLAEVQSAWPNENEMVLNIKAMGQDIAASLEVEEARVRVHLMLPGMLGYFSAAIQAAVKEGGTRMLEDKSKA